jgi:hypothetical protein
MSKSTFILVSLTMLGAVALAIYVVPSEAQKEPAASAEKPFARAAEGKALFEEKCRTVAGEKIYRKVENVEGVLLLKVRPRAGEWEWATPMWPGAAFAHEFKEDAYIRSFFWFEHSGNNDRLSPTNRGYLNTTPSSVPGYRFVEVVDAKDAKRYRYTFQKKEREIVDSVLIGGSGKRYKVMDWALEREIAQDAAPRYAVTFEDYTVASERLFGVAGGTIRVVDTSTGEVIAERTKYVWTPSGPSKANPSPWLTARVCPVSRSFAETRQFVDQVLIPVKAK